MVLETRYASYWAIVAGIAWLAFLFVSGKVAGGALSWFEIGNRSYQPACFSPPSGNP